MCGICGEIRFDGAPVDPRAIDDMRDRLVHRGPDEAGRFVSPGARAGLGFRRLSIIDLTHDGSQPMANEDGTVHVVFNGEIYNFRELREQLKARGHQFRSRTDTETIVHLYEEKGPACIEQLDGMFALAVWDDRAGTLTLARDRAGKKPLFYTRDERRLLFGSEMKAMLGRRDVAVEINRQSLPAFFIYGYVPGPETPYHGISQLDPGSVLTIDASGKQSVRRYWSLRFPTEQELTARPAVDRAAATAHVRDLVTAAVERRLVSDVPLGAFLSGGVDSTVVVGVMSRLSDRPVKTFSIGFEGDAAYDETAFARQVADRFHTDHTEFKVTPSALELIDTLIWHHDGPFGDSSAIPTYLLSRLTRQHVTVALTGDGGDEVFAGYVRFQAALFAERLPRALRGALSAVAGALPTGPNERHWRSRAKRFVRALGLPLHERVTRWNSYFYDDFGSADPLRHIRRFMPGMEGRSPLSQLLLANFVSYLPDDLLVKTDRCTMANSLEARAPFLDRALMEYVAQLPDHFKLDGRRTKAILRDAFADIIPAGIDTRAKAGFGVPLDAWFRGELRGYVRDLLLAPNAKYRDYISTGIVHRTVERHEKGTANEGQRLWTLVCFERWLQLLPSFSLPVRPVRGTIPTPL